jgi:hypothetical protein
MNNDMKMFWYIGESESDDDVDLVEVKRGSGAVTARDLDVTQFPELAGTRALTSDLVQLLNLFFPV